MDVNEEFKLLWNLKKKCVCVWGGGLGPGVLDRCERKIK